jgi:very-short-patch-repair endonuclease
VDIEIARRAATQHGLITTAQLAEAGLSKAAVAERAKAGRWTVDFLWRAQRLVVETDTWRYHGGEVSFEDDHSRDLVLRRRGYTVHRFTDQQIRAESELVAADVAAALAQRG